MDKGMLERGLRRDRIHREGGHREQQGVEEDKSYRLVDRYRERCIETC